MAAAAPMMPPARPHRARREPNPAARPSRRAPPRSPVDADEREGRAGQGAEGRGLASAAAGDARARRGGARRVARGEHGRRGRRALPVPSRGGADREGRQRYEGRAAFAVGTTRRCASRGRANLEERRVEVDRRVERRRSPARYAHAEHREAAAGGGRAQAAAVQARAVLVFSGGSLMRSRSSRRSTPGTTRGPRENSARLARAPPAGRGGRRGACRDRGSGASRSV